MTTPTETQADTQCLEERPEESRDLEASREIARRLESEALYIHRVYLRSSVKNLKRLAGED